MTRFEVQLYMKLVTYTHHAYNLDPQLHLHRAATMQLTRLAQRYECIGEGRNMAVKCIYYVITVPSAVGNYVNATALHLTQVFVYTSTVITLLL